MRFTPRRSVAIISLLLSTFLFFVGAPLYTLISLWTENWSADRIHSAELNSTYALTHPPLIPKIIHQTWRNETIPPAWRAAQESCQRLHGDWEYMLWTDDKSADFIASEYPWMRETWESYEFNIERADAIRYFVLAHYGGVYLDFDKVCSFPRCVHLN
jgi:mannosyltransferase OCH1-like enzyme